MLPTFRQHAGRYGFGLCLGVSLLCLLMTFALLRNSQAPGLLELLPAGFAIAFGVTLGASRDAPGYWIYAARALKFMVLPAELQQLQRMRIGPLVAALNPLQRPLSLPLLLGGLITLLLWAGLTLVPAYPAAVALLVLGLLFPLLLALLLTGSASYFMVLASDQGENALLPHMRRLRDAGRYRVEDLGVSLSISLALIWPLHNRADFDLQGGYERPQFVVAAMILGWIVTFFMLLGARRSRLHAAVGERLSALLRNVPHDQVAGGGRGLPRMALYYALVGLWALLLCWVLARLPQPLPFPLFCALLLVVPGWAFWHERGLTISRDAEQAGQFIDELGVQPVAAGMPQRP
ncbi:hypothetical protein AAFN46_10805 [Pseudomonas sp. CAU 1711]|uniref:hypothetical protein n=1 Tax=Pseudomonas sp. CAU 1711 TaxID=3140356 RepID=UPI00326099D2